MVSAPIGHPYSFCGVPHWQKSGFSQARGAETKVWELFEGSLEGSLASSPSCRWDLRRGRFFLLVDQQVSRSFFSNPSHFTVFEPCLFTTVGFLGGLVGNLNLRPRNRDHWKGSAELRACDFLLARECASSVVTDLSFIAEKLQILSLFHWSSHAEVTKVAISTTTKWTTTWSMIAGA